MVQKIGPGLPVSSGEKCAPRNHNSRLRLDIRKTLLNGTIFQMEDNKVTGPKLHGIVHGNCVVNILRITENMFFFKDCMIFISYIGCWCVSICHFGLSQWKKFRNYQTYIRVSGNIRVSGLSSPSMQCPIEFSFKQSSTFRGNTHGAGWNQLSFKTWVMS